MDEIDDARLHQWLSGCRALMGVSPQRGIEQIDLESPFGALRFQFGWNRNGDTYVYVPETEGVEAAFSTLTPPPPGTPVHEVPPGPSMLSAMFWHTLMPRFAEEVVAGPAGAEWRAEEMETIARGIERAHLEMLGEGVDKAFTEMAQAALHRMARARDESFAGRRPLLDAYLAPVTDLTRAYMSFRLPGKFAAETLAWLLMVQLNLPELGPVSKTPPDAWVRAIEHLIALANRLVRQRAEVKVAPYCELSYLANLYFLTASTLRENAEQGSVLPEDRLERVRDLTFVGEERRAHEVVPVFYSGLAANEAQILLKAAADTGESLVELCRGHATHPALKRVLRSLPAPAEADPEKVLREFREAARSFEEHDVCGRLEDDYSPVAPGHREMICGTLERISAM